MCQRQRTLKVAACTLMAHWRTEKALPPLRSKQFTSSRTHWSWLPPHTLLDCNWNLQKDQCSLLATPSLPTFPHSKGVKSQKVSPTIAGKPQISKTRKELGSQTWTGCSDRWSHDCPGGGVEGETVPDKELTAMKCFQVFSDMIQSTLRYLGARKNCTITGTTSSDTALVAIA